MGRGTTRRPKKKDSGRPSIFFILALTIGIVLLVWAFSQVVRKPVARHGYSSGATRAAINA